MDYYTGEIRIFCGLFRDNRFTVADWLVCDGSEVNKKQLPGLYSVIGDAYNLPTTPGDRFRLPDLRGAVPIGTGVGQAGYNYVRGAAGGGSTSVVNGVPSHSHAMSGSSDDANSSDPTGKLTPDTASRGGNGKYSNASPDSKLNVATIASSGMDSPAPVNIVQPYLVVNYLICYNGQGG